MEKFSWFKNEKSRQEADKIVKNLHFGIDNDNKVEFTDENIEQTLKEKHHEDTSTKLNTLSKAMELKKYLLNEYELKKQKRDKLNQENLDYLLKNDDLIHKKIKFEKKLKEIDESISFLERIIKEDNITPENIQKIEEEYFDLKARFDAIHNNEPEEPSDN